MGRTVRESGRSALCSAALVPIAGIVAALGMSPAAARAELYVGRFPEARARLEAMASTTLPSGFDLYMSAIAQRLGAILGDSRLPFGDPALIARNEEAALIWYETALRRGHQAARPASTSRSLYVRANAAIADAVAATLSGDEATAADLLRPVIRACVQHDAGPTEVELRHMMCEVAGSAGDRVLLTDAVEGLHAAAERTRSARFLLEARFFAWLAATGPADLRELEAIAQQGNCAPQAARRARALLGLADPLDGIEQRIVRSDNPLRRSVAIETRVTGAAPEARSWGHDRIRGRVWLPDGREVDISRRTGLGALLTALGDADGPLSVEALAERVWNVRSFHPLRDAKRVHVALSKLRALIEDDRAAPRRIVTVPEGGYAIGKDEPFRVAFLRDPE